jgi:voltage-gated potassium channel
MLGGLPPAKAFAAVAAQEDVVTSPQPSRLPWRRGAVTAFVERHHVLWEGVMVILAAAYLALTFLTDESRANLTPLVGALGAVFVAEFTLRILDAPSRYVYLRHHWLDLVSCFPLIGGLRSLRLLRLLRLGAALRLLSLAEKRAGGRESLWYLGPLLLMIWVGAAAAYWTFEHDQNHVVHSFGDALYWAFITVTTVGYGDVTPVTPEGKILSGVLIFLGIGFIGVTSSRMTSHWLRSTDGTATLHGRIDHLETRLVEMHALLLRHSGLAPMALSAEEPGFEPTSDGGPAGAGPAHRSD